MKKYFFLILALFIGFYACDDDDNTLSYEEQLAIYEEQLAIDIEKIQNYLDDNNLTAQSTESGLHYIIEEEGTGTYPALDSIIEIGYEGRFLESGEVFSSDTISGELSWFIYGWQEGVQLFNEGSKGTLLIPSGLAYGPYDYGSIPGNSVLIFDIELFGVTAQ